MEKLTCKRCDIPKLPSEYYDYDKKKCIECHREAMTDYYNRKKKREGFEERSDLVIREADKFRRLMESTQSCQPPSWGKLCESKMMNQWKYPEKGAYDVWMEQKNNLVVSK